MHKSALDVIVCSAINDVPAFFPPRGVTSVVRIYFAMVFCNTLSLAHARLGFLAPISAAHMTLVGAEKT